MTTLGPRDATLILGRSAAGEQQATNELVTLVYDELRRIAAAYLRRERCDHTLQPTALVHEVYVRLIDGSKVDWKGRTHFLALAARGMRRVLIDHARGHNSKERGGGWRRVTLSGVGLQSKDRDVDALDLEDALEELAALKPRHVDVVRLRYFGGLTCDEAAQALGISPKTVEKDWTMARAWLSRRLRRGRDDDLSG